MLSGKTTLVAHLAIPTFAFKAPLIYNPWFEKNGIDAVVVPMGVQVPDYPDFFRALFHLTIIRGALVTMPHKVTDDRPGGRAVADRAGVRGGQRRAPARRRDARGRPVRRRGVRPRRGAQGVPAAGHEGAGGRQRRVGSPIAASLAAAGVASMSLFDPNAAASESLGARLREAYPDLEVLTGSKDPAGHDLVVNATPLGMNDDDPLPMDVDRIAPGTFVGEVVMSRRSPVPARRAGQGLPDPGGQGHAVRDDPGLPGVLRLRHRHARGAARRRQVEADADGDMPRGAGVIVPVDDVTEVAPGSAPACAAVGHPRRRPR
jgi:shikimate dehydrogenase